MSSPWQRNTHFTYSVSDENRGPHGTRKGGLLQKKREAGHGSRGCFSGESNVVEFTGWKVLKRRTGSNDVGAV